MILRQHSPTAVCAGVNAWETLRPEIGAGAVFVVDANIDFDVRADRVLLVSAGETDMAAVVSLAERLAGHAPATVVGVGGGSVLDLVKLACLVWSNPGLADALEAWGRRAGLVALPADRPVTPRLIFAPTTLGTGVEVSAVACVSVTGHKRLVSGNQLRPDVAILDPVLTASLPHELLREGVLEALLRIIGPVVGSACVGGLPDAEAAMLVGQLVEVGDRLAAGDTGEETRLRAAMLSAATHTSWALSGRDRFSAKHWYLANELSTVLGLRKMTVTARLVPEVWSRVMRGDRRYGDVTRLTEAWSWAEESEPVTGIRGLIDRWRLSPQVEASREALRAAAVRVVTSWGHPFPMLPGISAMEIESLFAEALCST